MTLAIKAAGKAVRNLSRSQHDIKVTTSIEGVRPTADQPAIIILVSRLSSTLSNMPPGLPDTGHAK